MSDTFLVGLMDFSSYADTCGLTNMRADAYVFGKLSKIPSFSIRVLGDESTWGCESPWMNFKDSIDVAGYHLQSFKECNSKPRNSTTDPGKSSYTKPSPPLRHPVRVSNLHMAPYTRRRIHIRYGVRLLVRQRASDTTVVHKPMPGRCGVVRDGARPRFTNIPPSFFHEPAASQESDVDKYAICGRDKTFCDSFVISTRCQNPENQGCNLEDLHWENW